MNINEYVWVTLTREGLDCLMEYYRELASYLPPDKRGLVRVPESQAHRRRPVKFQLWELMRIFGPEMEMGAQPMFDGNEIIFVDPDKHGQ